MATLVVRLKPWDERQSDDLGLQAILKRMQTAYSKVPEATVSAFGMPPIQGLSVTGGFQLMLEDRLGGSLQDFSQVADLLVQAARKRPELTNVSSTFHANVPSYSIDVDLDKVQTLGIPVTATYDTLQTFLGGLYVNDFNTFGRTWQVVVQAEPEFRTQPSDINRYYVRNNDGNMARWGPYPLSVRLQGLMSCIDTTDTARFKSWAARRPDTAAARPARHGGGRRFGAPLGVQL